MGILKKGSSYSIVPLDRFTFQCCNTECNHSDTIDAESLPDVEKVKCSKCQSKMVCVSWSSNPNAEPSKEIKPDCP